MRRPSGSPGILRRRKVRFGIELTQPLSLMMVELDGPSTGLVAPRLQQVGAMKHTLVDDIDGAVVVLCGTTRALDVRHALSAWVRSEAGANHRGVVSRPMASPAELPSLYAMQTLDGHPPPAGCAGTVD
jgi:hypothetical protein